jgi:hypothetical protein
MQRIEHFNNDTKLVENLTGKAPSSTPSAPRVAPSPTVAAPVSVTLCRGSNYINGDTDMSCACNVTGQSVKHQTGDGKQQLDYCTNGALPLSHTGNYCTTNSSKLVFDPDTKTVSYRVNATTKVGSDVPAVTKRWCAT